MDNKLIESALQLTGKTMEEMEIVEATNNWFIRYFSMPKFCYYLLSDEFIDTYTIKTNWLHCYYKWIAPETCSKFWQAIYEYQSWNEQPLIDLLSKI